MWSVCFLVNPSRRFSAPAASSLPTSPSFSKLLHGLLGMASDVAHRDAAFFGLLLGDLDELLTALLGQLGEDTTDHLAVIGWVDPEIGFADRLLDIAAGH
jgi:hypothetical protein